MRLSLWITCLVTWVIAEDCQPGTLSEQSLVNLSQQCFREKYDPTLHDSPKLNKLIKSRLSKQKKLLHRLKMTKINHVKTTPVLKWAQNEDTIFINFKLSHRHDSPPCSHIEFQQINMTNVDSVEGEFEVQQQLVENFNKSSFSFECQCYFTDQKFLFSFVLEFSNELNKVSLEREGFGSYTLIGKKRQSQIWIDPFQDVRQAAIWPQMRQKYAKSMDQYFEMREKRKEEEESSKPRRKRKRPKKQEGSGEKNQQAKEKENTDL